MSERRCASCGRQIIPHAVQVGDKTDFVEVKAGTSITTAYEGGYPADGHLATTFAGTYCSLQCAGDHLADHLSSLPGERKEDREEDDHEAVVARESERADKAEAKLSEIGKLVGYWEHEKPIRGSALQSLEAARKATQGCADDLRSLLPGNEEQEVSDAH